MTTTKRIEGILRAHEGRDPVRLALKWQAMAANPFGFFRGTCALFYEDLPPGALEQAPRAWICGDLHLQNFGSYKGDNRLVYFDLNDFDEACLAPCTWELARLAASVHVGLRELGVRARERRRLAAILIDAYAAALCSGKPRWIERGTAEGMIAALFERLRKRKRRTFLEDRTFVTGGRRHLKIDGKRTLPLADGERGRLRSLFARLHETTCDAKFFRFLDAARRIAGTGSLGVERFVILVEGSGSPNGNYLLDLKRNDGSALAPRLIDPQPAWENEAARVVWVQWQSQAIAPAFLQAVEWSGHSFVLRELMPTADRVDLTRWKGDLPELEGLLTSLGELTAWGHLRCSGYRGAARAEELLAFGKQQPWRAELLAYAEAYDGRVREDARDFRRWWRASAPKS